MFGEGGIPENPEKNPRCIRENNISKKLISLYKRGRSVNQTAVTETSALAAQPPMPPRLLPDLAGKAVLMINRFRFNSRLPCRMAEIFRR